MPLTTREVIARLDAIGDCLTLEADPPRSPETPLSRSSGATVIEHPDVRMRRAVFLLGKLRGELQVDRAAEAE
jgi:hypothetical protein